MTEKRFADFAKEESPLAGPKEKIDAILNQEICITGFVVRQSKYKDKGNGKCMTIQFERVGEKEKKIFFTGSIVLIDQLEKYGDEVPFITTIKKIDKYYTMT